MMSELSDYNIAHVVYKVKIFSTWPLHNSSNILTVAQFDNPFGDTSDEGLGFPVSCK